jgi:glycosyltransferase involved in cell wall biosynthesis
VYAQATGYGARGNEEHLKCDHFAVAIIEALAAGCQVYAYALGASKEILARARAGRTFATLDELAALLDGSNTAGLAMQTREVVNREFNDGSFMARLGAALAQPPNHGARSWSN